MLLHYEKQSFWQVEHHKKASANLGQKYTFQVNSKEKRTKLQIHIYTGSQLFTTFGQNTFDIIIFIYIFIYIYKGYTCNPCCIKIFTNIMQKSYNRLYSTHTCIGNYQNYTYMQKRIGKINF